MTDYGHPLRFGSFLTPRSAEPAAVVELAQFSERLGLDLVTFQDHPYQPALLDAWTLLSYVAAATERVQLAPNVANLPLRSPAVLARAAASLDLLSGGRVELGLGAGAFTEAIAAMGGPRRSAGESVEALAEAVAALRAIWDTGTRGGVRTAGPHYPLNGAKRGPAPAHPIGIWVGGYKPRMLRLTGRLADGWLPSLAYLPPEELASANRVIDEAAESAGRDPAAVRRLYNISGRFDRGGGLLQGTPADWAEQLAGLVLEHGMSTFVLASDEPRTLATYAEEVAPEVRALVEHARRKGTPPPTSAAGAAATTSGLTAPAPSSARPRPSRPFPPAGLLPGGTSSASASFPVAATPDPGVRLAESRWNEAERPTGPEVRPAHAYGPQQLAASRQLVAVHDHLRSELTQVRELVEQVRDGTLDAAAARGRINEMTMRQNNWTLGAYCAAYCRVVTLHHTIEDQALFPRLRSGDPALRTVIDRLQYEHEVIHAVLEDVDRALVAFVGPADSDHRAGEALQRAVDVLTDTLLSHLSYEERELLEPIARLGVPV